METEPQGFEIGQIEYPSDSSKRPEIVGVPEELVRGTKKALAGASRPEPVTQPLKPVETEKLNAEALNASLAKRDKEILAIINKLDPNNREQHMSTSDRKTNFIFWAGTISKLPTDLARREFFLGDTGEGRFGYPQKATAYFDMLFEKQDLTKLITAIGNINPKTLIEKPGLIQRSLEKIGFKKQSTTQEEINTKNLEQLYLLLQNYFTESPTKNE